MPRNVPAAPRFDQFDPLGREDVLGLCAPPERNNGWDMLDEDEIRRVIVEPADPLQQAVLELQCVAIVALPEVDVYQFAHARVRFLIAWAPQASAIAAAASWNVGCG